MVDGMRVCLTKSCNPLVFGQNGANRCSIDPCLVFSEVTWVYSWPKSPLKVAPNGVDVIGVVLCVIQTNQKERYQYAVTVRVVTIDSPRPCEIDIPSSLIDLGYSSFSEFVRNIAGIFFHEPHKRIELPGIHRRSVDIARAEQRSRIERAGRTSLSLAMILKPEEPSGSSWVSDQIPVWAGRKAGLIGGATRMIPIRLKIQKRGADGKSLELFAQLWHGVCDIRGHRRLRPEMRTPVASQVVLRRYISPDGNCSF